MSNINTPASDFKITTLRPSVVDNDPQRILIVGQGTNAVLRNGELFTDIAISGEEDDLFGRRSMLATMVREFRRINSTNTVDAISVLDPDGAKAEAVINFSATSTHDAGTLSVVIQSKQLHTFTVSIRSSDSAENIRDNALALIQEDDTVLVAASAIGSTTIRLVSIHAGVIGNTLGIEISNHPQGVVAISYGFSGGTGDVDLTNIFNKIIDQRYQTIVWPGGYDNEPVADFLNARFNSTSNAQDGVAFSSQSMDEQQAIEEAGQINSESYVLFANKKVNRTNYKGSAMFEFDPVIASQFAAIRSLRLTLDQNISQFLVGVQTRGTSGGPTMAAVPYHNTPMPNLPVVEIGLNWTTEEQMRLNDNGVSFFGNNLDRSSIVPGDVVTTNTNTDEFKYLNYIDTASNVREFFVNNLQSTYSQSSLTTGDLSTGINSVNEQSFRTQMVYLYLQLANSSDDGTLYELVDSSQSAVRFFRESLGVNIDLRLGKITTTAKIPLVTQVRGISGVFVINYDLSLS